MGKGFSRIAVRDALYHMFGPDSKPNSRDVLRVTQEAKHTGTEHVNLAADDWADESPEENHEYEFDEWHEWHEDDVYTHDTWEDEQPDAEEHESVPEDLESAADQVEEAFATWQESRRLMNEMAKERGFYPVTNKLEYMQAPAWVSRDGSGHKCKSKGKGGGKPRSYGKKATATRWRKGTGKSNTGANSSSASAPAAAPPPNTSAHGATSQHGPRFKRTRFGAPHEVKMVEEIHQCFFPGDEVDDPIGMGLDCDTIVAEVLNVEVGTGAADSGATLPVVGMKCWKHWLRLPWIRAHEAEIKYDRCNKLFRFGGGKTLPSTMCVSFPVKVFNTVRQLTVYLIDSDAPLLIARPTLEEWGLYVISGTNESSCLMSPNLVGRFCHNRIKDIYCLILWIPKRSVTRWFRVPLTLTFIQLMLWCRRVERSRLRRASRRVPMRETHLLMTKKILNRMCCLPNLSPRRVWTNMTLLCKRPMIKWKAWRKHLSCGNSVWTY